MFTSPRENCRHLNVDGEYIFMYLYIYIFISLYIYIYIYIIYIYIAENMKVLPERAKNAKYYTKL